MDFLVKPYVQKIFTIFLFLFFVLQSADAQYRKPVPQPAADVPLSASSSFANAEPNWASLTFTSETSLAVGACFKDCTNEMCSLSLVRWERGTLQPIAQTARFDTGTSLHSASEARVLAIRGLAPTFLYSADLSTVLELPKGLSRFFSPSEKL
jgi:hypothetical protein